MTKILFICLGNICRSPMAEFVMKDLVNKEGLQDEFYIESAATSNYETGNSVYPPAKRKLNQHGINCDGKTARQMTKQDYNDFDYLIGMDASNLKNMKNTCGGDKEEKMHLLTDFTDNAREIADPYFTGDFEATWNDVLDGCRGLLNYIKNKR